MTYNLPTWCENWTEEEKEQAEVIVSDLNAEELEREKAFEGMEQPEPLESENCFQGWTTEDFWQFCLNCYKDYSEENLTMDQYKADCGVEFSEAVKFGATKAETLEDYIRETAAHWVDVMGYSTIMLFV